MKSKREFRLPKGHWPSAVLNDDPRDFDFVPSKEELIAERRQKNWLAKMQTLLLRYQREDDELRRKRATEIAREVAADREKQAREDRLARDTNWWLQERERDKPIMEKLTARYQEIMDAPFRKKMLAKLAELEQLDKKINRAAAREERKTLLARGVLKGRRKV
jgi:hypothetical protein